MADTTSTRTTHEESVRLARIRAAYGCLKSSGHAVDDFLREEREDTEREEERLRRRPATGA